jgi:hypothetical protein
MTIHIDSETDEQQVERCDDEGTTEPLGGMSSVSVCTSCGETWPTPFGPGAPTVRLVATQAEEDAYSSAVVRWLLVCHGG